MLPGAVAVICENVASRKSRYRGGRSTETGKKGITQFRKQFCEHRGERVTGITKMTRATHAFNSRQGYASVAYGAIKRSDLLTEEDTVGCVEAIQWQLL